MALLFVHVTLSVAWLGAIASFLVFSLKGQFATNPLINIACAQALKWIGWWLVVPLCVSAFVSGIVQGLVSAWGLIQHYWVLLKLLLMVGATALLLLHMQAVDWLQLGGSPELLKRNAFVFSSLTFDAGAAVLLVLVLTALSIFKPAGQIFVRNPTPPRSEDVE
jgi:hypothetical protein